jgi:DNA-binding HxlR family transcriptional regulator
MPQATKKPVPRRSGCPLNAVLEVLGDQWSLLIVRDLMFSGRNTYAELMEGGEGIATNILADRLRRLEEEGIITRRAHPSDGRRQMYELTTKGADLAPVLVEMIVWSAHYHETDAPPAVVRRMKTRRDEVIAVLRANALQRR